MKIEDWWSGKDSHPAHLKRVIAWFEEYDEYFIAYFDTIKKKWFITGVDKELKNPPTCWIYELPTKPVSIIENDLPF